ncbi:SDR family NAD(P)-dependent oxidoreductase [Labrenzia sp. R4_1]|uniref:type I polyketide synthase n=1 Tax=Labrenzia sp. R4_1 TaxID=2821106 RepID=UPI001AD952BA|nr:SDR family NAD(P)-dependent oxidoreductase [Labrenzia sp. R4_1]MBO9423178.1 SDR family NAD(P)-dependent oxidoreductase [Labrenzia sp. R4_1]
MTIGSTDAGLNDVAIVGMALRVPGARNTDEFWENLRNGVESVRTLSDGELEASGEDPVKAAQPNYIPRTADIPDMELFDPEFFGLSPKEAAIMDPQHRHFLECAWEAIEDAGRPPETIEGPVGVYAGCGMGSYFYFNVCSDRQLMDQVGMFLLRHTGNDKDFLATRASYAFDLKGPSVNVQTACSTSLVAVHYACQSLLNGETDMALAGGVTIDLPHRRGYVFQDGEILSPDGHCRPFDHRAAGTIFGSGAGVVVLRRLEDAIADGDNIHAVIKASAINNDGHSKAGYLAPSVTGQAEAIIEAQALGGIEADTIQYVECHGTGTYLGDPIEIEALTQAFRQSTNRTGYCRVGSVKSNIGHLDTAAGVVSLIKTSLALKNGEIPPSLGYEKPNPSIDFANSPFVVNDRLTPWPVSAGPQRAAVNSLGVGGTNAHVILEKAPMIADDSGRFDDEPQLILLSAKAKKGLADTAARLADALENDPSLPLASMAETLFHGRKPFEHRQIAAVRGRTDAISVLRGEQPKRLAHHQAGDHPGIATFLFPGGGAQHPGMARRLYQEDSSFRQSVDEGLAFLPSETAARIRELWFPPEGSDLVQAAEGFLTPSLQLPAILILEVSLARLWMSWGVQPTALIGHSMGENTAACISGVLSYRDAVGLVHLRGKLFDTVDPGGMLSIPLSETEVRALMPASLDMASVNAPELCVVSGRDEDLEDFRKALLEKDIDATRIAIDIAAHSRMLEGILPKFEQYLRSIALNRPQIPIMSNLTGDWLTDAEARDPSYWARHLRSTVQFGAGMTRLSADPNRVYIEVGPGKTLSSLAKLKADVTANQVFNTLPHADDDADDRLSFLTAIGRCWAAGLKADVARCWRDFGPKRVSLPPYAFQRQHYFVERNVAKDGQAGSDIPLLRQKDMRDWGYRPAWKRSVPDYVTGADKEPRSWLVFLDDTGTGEQLAGRLKSAGHQVTTVQRGDVFAKVDPHTYILCSEEGRPGYDALVTGILEDGPFPGNIVHGCLLTQDESHRPGSNFFERMQEDGFYSLLYLAQALDEQSALEEAHLTVLTNGMMRVGDEPVVYPSKSTVLGPVQVLPKELSGLSVRLIDLEISAATNNQQHEVALDDLWDELFAKASSEIVAHRGSRRWQHIHERLPLEDGQFEGQFQKGGTYLITGGLGDLAIIFAKALVEDHDANIVLVGRRSLPEKQDRETYLRTHSGEDPGVRALGRLSELEALGGKVLYVPADVTNPEEIGAAVAAAKARFGAINGVLHTAGIVDDDLVQLKTLENTQHVLAPKVQGTRVLDMAFADEPLDLMVLFSSTSTDTAPIGQVDYVAANAFLNAYAESKSGDRGRSTVAVHWGIWSDIGLAARAVSGKAAVSETAITVGAAKGPLFERWITDASNTRWLEFTASTQKHWMWNEHRLVSGDAILPGTGYIELIAQAYSELDFDQRPDIRDLVFFKPLSLDDGQPRNIRVRFEAQAHGTLKAIVAATETEDPSASVEVYAGALVCPLKSVPLPVQLEDLQAQLRWTDVRTAPDNGTMPSAQSQHIKFGPRWDVLRSLSLGRGEALARLTSPAGFEADYSETTLAHPGLLDIATGYAMELIEGFKSSGVLWAPVSYSAIRLYEPLPSDVIAHVRFVDENAYGDGFGSFDITVMRPDGTVVLEADRLTVKRLSNDTGFAKDVQTGASQDAAALYKLAAQVKQGIPPEQGFETLQRALATGETQPIISTMPLDLLIKNAEAEAQSRDVQDGQLFERPDLDSAYEAPRNPLEIKLAEFWSELLGIEKIGVHDDFFDIGGHSLIAVRLFRMIRQTYGVDLPMSVLFDAPTIAECAELLASHGVASDRDASAEVKPEQTAKADETVHLVSMSKGPGTGATPLFICAGMFGNILNLRQLALLVGRDRPVYGLQARGLFGNQEPHETFEEMARDYLAEIRQVQPHGPYILGGFSGGGIVAYEMAQQLTAQGEEVAEVILLDTPVPEKVHLSLVDRVMIKWQDLQKNKTKFFSVWLRNRREWRARTEAQQNSAGDQATAESFNNERIRVAFMRAHDGYEVRPYNGRVVLYRPKAEVLYKISGGRRLQDGLNILREDNGWSPFVSELSIVEVPGDHDSMVLNPNIQVLASRMRKSLEARTAAALGSDKAGIAAE